MNSILLSFHHHQVLWTLGSYIVLSNAINTMPPPDSKSGKLYIWFYNFSHALSVQVGHMMQDKMSNILKGANDNASSIISNSSDSVVK